MKTSGFIKRVKELGYGAYVVFGGVDEVRVRRDNNMVARVSINEVNKLDTFWEEDIPSELFDLLFEYASTPIEERKDVKKYYLYNPVKGAYFNYYVERGLYDWFSPTEDYGVQTKFTEEEIKNHELRDLMELLVKEEVE